MRKMRKKAGEVEEEEEEEGQIQQRQRQRQPTSVLLYLHRLLCLYVLPLFHVVVHAPLARVFQNSDRWSV